MFDVLRKDRIIADKAFNRWMVPPAALFIHLSIGMIYGFSIFWDELTKLVGVECDASVSFMERIFTTSCDWLRSDVVWTFAIAIVFLGMSAAIFGHWLEKAGPRKAGFAAAIAWGGGLMIAALGASLHQLWLIWLGAGVIGGIGLGLGYISPVSTLIKWFPDRRGLATGMAIMGFGGGAMIGMPLGDSLITSYGVAQTFFIMGCIYVVSMSIGAFGYRVPAEGWKPEGWNPEIKKTSTMISTNHVHVSTAHKTPQFWLLWGVLCLNVSAGIGVLSVAKPMFEEIAKSSFEDAIILGAVATGFGALLSFANIIGRIFWASSSDFLGRKLTYAIFFSLGTALYFSAPIAADYQYIATFVLINLVILTMYGGGFATIPAYLADIFGTQHVGAIHGRLLTAWSLAGIIGPMLISYLREYQLALGIPTDQAYNSSFKILAGLLVLGFILNLLVKPVNKKFFMNEKQLKDEQGNSSNKEVLVASTKTNKSLQSIILPLAWLVVSVPIGWGILNALQKGLIIFQ
jgi:MFS family permease